MFRHREPRAVNFSFAEDQKGRDREREKAVEVDVGGVTGSPSLQMTNRHNQLRRVLLQPQSLTAGLMHASNNQQGPAAIMFYPHTHTHLTHTCVQTDMDAPDGMR